MTRSVRAWRKAAREHKSISIPIIVIVALLALLGARELANAWPALTLRPLTPHADAIPDSADLLVTVRLDRLSNAERRNALNRWRSLTTERGHDNKDVTQLLSEWTGHGLTDNALDAWAGRRATLFVTPDGYAIMIDVRDADAATES